MQAKEIKNVSVCVEERAFLITVTMKTDDYLKGESMAKRNKHDKSPMPMDEEIKKMLEGTVSDLLNYAASFYHPNELYTKAIEYTIKTTRIDHILLVFRNGFTMCDNRFPIKEEILNKKIKEPSFQKCCKECFDCIDSEAGRVLQYSKDKIPAHIKKLLGDEVLNHFNENNILIGNMFWKKVGETVAILVCIAEEGVKFIPLEEMYVKNLTDALRWKVRTLVSRYFGDEYNYHNVSNNMPFFEGRKRIVAMFCDIRNFTPFISMVHGNESENVCGGLQEYFEKASKTIFENSGMLDKFIGDGIMALFGIEHGMNVAVKNACNTAKSIIRTFTKIKKDHFEKILEERSEYLDLQLGIGIDAGSAILGFYGNSYSAIGDPINTAARLENIAGKAHPDYGHTLSNILVGSAAYNILTDDERETMFKDEPLILPVKGKPLPIRAYEYKKTA